jgi:hypothetical protein
VGQATGGYYLILKGSSGVDEIKLTELESKVLTPILEENVRRHNLLGPGYSERLSGLTGTINRLKRFKELCDKYHLPQGTEASKTIFQQEFTSTFGGLSFTWMLESK